MNSTILFEKLKTLAWALALFSLLAADVAKALLSISMGVLVLVYLIELIVNVKSKQLSYYAKPVLILVIGMVVLYALQFVTSTQTDYLWERITIKLPFILIGLSVLYGKPIQLSNFYKLLQFFVGMITIVSVLMFINYLMNWQQINEAYARSGVMPGPISHIRLSIMMAFAVYIAYYVLFKTQAIARKSLNYKLLMSSFVFLILFIHVYSVRGGLLALYALAVFEFGCFVYHSKNRKKLVLGASILAVLAASSFVVVPTLSNKLAITKQDLMQYQEGRNLNHNSLGKRFVSYQAAWHLFNENPIMGCGIGDYSELNLAYFHEHHPEIEVPIIAHNQFLYFMASAGLLGMLLFACSFFSPLLYTSIRFPQLLLAHLMVLFVSFQTEPMLETQLGVAYSALFWFLPLCVNVDSKDKA